ncbi:MAG: putative sugar kinase YdjH [Rhodospirillaceae bacterium]|nr:MAG: putative sugar kinase YdjH [Rhodospirillaceae bacterium]
MNLIDEARALTLYDAMRDKTQQSGGSAANSAYGLAALGGSAAFAGQVCRDAVGDAFIADLVAGGVSFVGQQKEGGLATARSMIFVTPDGVRSMNTYLGTSLNLTANHIPADTGASVIYLEGYLFDAPEGPEIFKKAAEIAQQSDAQLALSLSDPWCVERHREQFSAFIREHVSILFSNEEEVTTLTGSDRIAAQQEMSAQLDELIITQGADGAVVCCEDAQVSVPAMPEGAVIDTTGAGDLFAAGYLYGRATGASALQSAELASLCAGEVICHYGARPAKPIAAFIEQAV